MTMDGSGRVRRRLLLLLLLACSDRSRWRWTRTHAFPSQYRSGRTRSLPPSRRVAVRRMATTRRNGQGGGHNANHLTRYDRKKKNAATPERGCFHSDLFSRRRKERQGSHLAAYAVDDASSQNSDDDGSPECRPRGRRRFSRWRAAAGFLKRNALDRPKRFVTVVVRRGRPFVLLVLAVLASSTAMLSRADAAGASSSAPPAALIATEAPSKKADSVRMDPVQEALLEQDRRAAAKAQRELDLMTKRARRIESVRGEAARRRFEREYRVFKEQQATNRRFAVAELKRELLDQGICPFTDMEGRRQILLAERGVDLGTVPGTPYYLEKHLERTAYKKSRAYKKETHRKVIACMVYDMKNRGIDPVEYFAANQDRTLGIMDLPEARAAALVREYRSRFEKYADNPVADAVVGAAVGVGEASPPVAPEEPNAVAKDSAAASSANSKKSDRREVKRFEAEVRATERQAKAKARKARIKAKARAAKKQAQNCGAMDFLDNRGTAARSRETAVGTTRSARFKLPIVPAATVLVGGSTAGAGYALHLWRQRVAREEEERRQRRFRSLMEGSVVARVPSTTTTPAVDDTDDGINDLLLLEEEETVAGSSLQSGPAAIDDAARGSSEHGIRNQRRRGSQRETDLRALVSGPTARAPEFATTLAKLLTFGAPGGAFPVVVSLPGEMPLARFDALRAQQVLTSERQRAQLTATESAEIFADVVTCMLIDVVDMAASSLPKGEDEDEDEHDGDDATVYAMNKVMDFMDMAAVLYDPVAAGASIEPVKYEGELSQFKLERMYMAYATQAFADCMSRMAQLSGGRGAGVDENRAAAIQQQRSILVQQFDRHMQHLQDVFDIEGKRSEEIMMKVLQRNASKMIKQGDRTDGMEGMAKVMETMSGDVGGSGTGGIDHDHVKQMLLDLKRANDAGEISHAEWETTKAEFETIFGSSIDDMILTAAEGSEGKMDANDRELLDIMRSILQD